MTILSVVDARSCVSIRDMSSNLPLISAHAERSRWKFSGKNCARAKKGIETRGVRPAQRAAHVFAALKTRSALVLLRRSAALRLHCIVDELWVIHELAERRDAAEDAAVLPRHEEGEHLRAEEVLVETALEIRHLDAHNLDELGREVLGEQRIRAAENELHARRKAASCWWNCHSEDATRTVSPPG